MSVVEQPLIATDHHDIHRSHRDKANIELRERKRDEDLVGSDDRARTTATPASSRTGDRLPLDMPLADRLHITERMVVAPLAGPFTPTRSPGLSVGDHVEKGTVIGSIGNAEIVSTFSGYLGGHLAMVAERVRHGQPLMWLRSRP